jgi:hypothetical protein
MLILLCFIFYTVLFYILYCIVYLHTGSLEQGPWETNWFTASQEISPFHGNQSFITAFTSACHLSLSWAHSSGSIQVWGTSLSFIIWYIFMVRSWHLTQTLRWSTTPLLAVHDCLFNIFAAFPLYWRLFVHAYLIYSQLPSILEAVPPSATWGRAMPWCRVLTYLDYIEYYDGFIITNYSEDVLSVCIINTTVFFLLDMFHS